METHYTAVTSFEGEAAMRWSEAKAIVRDAGMTIHRREREYRVNFRGGSETTAYYTDDRQDAVNTALGMAQERDAIQHVTKGEGYEV